MKPPHGLARISDRLLGKIAYRLSVRLANLDEQAKRSRCDSRNATVLHSSSRIENETTDRTRISIGANTHVLSHLQVFPNGGRITVGDDCYLGEDARIWSMESVSIGNRVLVSHGVNIHDSNAHSLSARDRHEHLSRIHRNGHPTQLDNVSAKPVIVEDDAWIGFNATVLKGVRVGRGAIVGACSVVTKDVPPFSVVAGNPAVIVGQSYV